MRQRYIVSYDIGDARRLRRVFRLLKGFGCHLHYSVFRCDLTPMQLALLRNELREIINYEEDRVLFGDMGPAEGRAQDAFEKLGRACEYEEYVASLDGPRVV